MNNICVLMSTYNGGKFLREQINSILNQVNANITLLIRDDGSSDNTLGILKEYEEQNKLTFYSGKNMGPAMSFIDLLFSAPEAEYYAFADQDDYWFKDKLQSGIKKLSMYSTIPAMYNSKAIVCDESLNKTGQLFGSDTVYNLATQISRSNCIGCTMIINRNLKNILMSYRPSQITMHDQWIAIVCKAVKGVEIKDNEAKIYYRQHSNNAVGTKSSVLRRIRSSSLRKGNSRLLQAIELKKGYYGSLDVDDKKILDTILSYNRSASDRIKACRISLNCENVYLNILIKIAFLRNCY